MNKIEALCHFSLFTLQMETGIAALSFPFSSAELVNERAGYGYARRRSFCIDESVRFPFALRKSSHRYQIDSQL